jgi:hypothetical protein
MNEVTLLTENALLWKPVRIGNKVAPVISMVGTMSAAFFAVFARIWVVLPAPKMTSVIEWE